MLSHRPRASERARRRVAWCLGKQSSRHPVLPEARLPHRWRSPVPHGNLTTARSDHVVGTATVIDVRRDPALVRCANVHLRARRQHRTCPPGHRDCDRTDRSLDDVASAIRELAAGRVLVLAPNDGEDLGRGAVLCDRPTTFESNRPVSPTGLCAFGMRLASLLRLIADAIIATSCGDCAAPLRLTVEGGRLERSADVVHFGVPARHFWDNLAFT